MAEPQQGHNPPADSVQLAPMTGVDSEFECKICYDNFDLDHRLPKILGCSHTFCEDCLSQVHAREGGGWRIPCPVCRHRTAVPEYRVQNLPNNTELTTALSLSTGEEEDSGRLSSAYMTARLAVIYAHHNQHAGTRPLPAEPDPGANSNTNQNHASNPVCKNVAITMCCVCAVVSPLAMLVLLFVGVILVHNFNDSTFPSGPICLSVGSVLAMVSVVLAWLMCWLKSPHESTPPDSNFSR